MSIIYKKISIELLRFSLVGLISTFVNYAIFFILLKYISVYYIYASSIGFLVGIYVSYSLNRRFTFISVMESKVKELFSYIAICFFSLILSLLVLRILVEVYSLNPLLGNLAAIAVSTISNFIGAKVFVFRSKFIQ